MRCHHDQAMRRQIALNARRCVEWLKVSGYEVLVVLGGSFQPRIVIKPSQLCGMLDGVVEAYERTPRGERRYNYVSRFDCMVEWEREGGGHAAGHPPAYPLRVEGGAV